MGVIAINKHALIKVDKDQEEISGGLKLQNIQGDRSEAVAIKGKVVDISEDFDDFIKVGDVVWCAKWDVQKVYLQAEEYLVAKKKDILLKEVKE